MQLPDLPQIEAAAAVVYREFQATPQYRWALLSERLGTDCWVKHENHTPVGAFKIRGGLTYFDMLQQQGRLPREVAVYSPEDRRRLLATPGITCLWQIGERQGGLMEVGDRVLDL